MEGVASEAASIAGHLKLGNIIYIYDDNKITIEGETDLTYTEEVEKRFQAYGWHTINIDGHNHEQIASAIDRGKKEKIKPTLIIARTHIGYGSPNKHDTSGVHGSPLGEDELNLTKKELGFTPENRFYIPEEVKGIFKQRVETLFLTYKAWQVRFAEWKSKYPEQNKLRHLLPKK